jgi:hypothetical protein
MPSDIAVIQKPFAIQYSDANSDSTEKRFLREVQKNASWQ